MITIDDWTFENEYDAADWVRYNATATGEYGIEHINDESGDNLEYTEVYTLDGGCEVLIMWTIPAKFENREMEDWPWDNGTARVVVDGYIVEEVA